MAVMMNDKYNEKIAYDALSNQQIGKLSAGAVTGCIGAGISPYEKRQLFLTYVQMLIPVAGNAPTSLDSLINGAQKLLEATPGYANNS